jgi:hypothetical protein
MPSVPTLLFESWLVAVWPAVSQSLSKLELPLLDVLGALIDLPPIAPLAPLLDGCA